MKISTFGEGLAYNERNKRKNVINKPVHIGFFVLELSKLLMYEFFYDVLQPEFGQENVHVLATDTDSFILQIYTKDLYERMDLLSDTKSNKLSNGLIIKILRH